MIMATEKSSKCDSFSLGVVAISFNEEKDLPGFLDHLYSWVDEIVIIDDGSTDKTRQIAEGYEDKVKFIYSPRVDGEYFSHQRNKGIDAAESDWLLHMDIDERVPPGLAGEIRQAIRDKGMDGYKYRRLNFFLHRPMRGGGWQDWNLVHLARKEVLRFGGMFHEDYLLDAPEQRIGQLAEKMYHFNDDSYKERMAKSNLYCLEQSSILKEQGIQVGWYHFFWLPFLEFANKYIRKNGYRDGILGVLFALHSACAKFKACALVWDEQNAKSRQSLEDELMKWWADDTNKDLSE